MGMEDDGDLFREVGAVCQERPRKSDGVVGVDLEEEVEGQVDVEQFEVREGQQARLSLLEGTYLAENRHKSRRRFVPNRRVIPVRFVQMIRKSE